MYLVILASLSSFRLETACLVISCETARTIPEDHVMLLDTY